MRTCCCFLLLALLFIVPCSKDTDAISGVDRVYVISNAEFGIRADKTNAKATTVGINKAIEQAKAEGYNVVELV